jgi:hypothetical protein
MCIGTRHQKNLLDKENCCTSMNLLRASGDPLRRLSRIAVIRRQAKEQ